MGWEISTCKLELCQTESPQPSRDKNYCPGPCSLQGNNQITGARGLFLKGSVEERKKKKKLTRNLKKKIQGNLGSKFEKYHNNDILCSLVASAMY